MMMQPCIPSSEQRSHLVVKARKSFHTNSVPRRVGSGEKGGQDHMGRTFLCQDVLPTQSSTTGEDYDPFRVFDCCQGGRTGSL